MRVKAKPDQPEWLEISATTKASTIQVSTSASAAEVRDNRPTGVSVMSRSLRMRAMIGKAVIDMDAAMKNANGQKEIPAGAKRSCRPGDMAMPSANGSSTLSVPTSADARRCRLAPPGRRNSAPTMNMNSTRPISLRPSSAERLAGANRKACACGASAPKTIGPRAMPASISPITGGCPKWRNTIARMRAVPRIATSWISSSGIVFMRTARRRQAHRTPAAPWNASGGSCRSRCHSG